MIKRIILAIALAIGIISVSVPAQAYDNSQDDTPYYVSQYEYNNATRMSMADIERSFGVVGLGKIVVWQNGGNNITKEYPYGSKWDCTGSVVDIAYAKNKDGVYMANYLVAYIYQVNPISHVQCKVSHDKRQALVTYRVPQ